MEVAIGGAPIVMNGTSEVTLAGPPSAGEQIQVRALVYNRDTIPHGVIFLLKKGGTSYEIQTTTGVAAAASCPLAFLATMTATDETLVAKLGEAMGTVQPVAHISGMRFP